MKERLEARGFEVVITDVRELDPATVDLVYNRSTDFTLDHAPALRKAWEEDRVVLTPSPWHHARALGGPQALVLQAVHGPRQQDGNVLAQREVPPPRRQVLVEGEGEAPTVQEMRFDLRAYTYGGVIRLLAARVLRGQTTNLSTPGGGRQPAPLWESLDGAARSERPRARAARSIGPGREVSPPPPP